MALALIIQGMSRLFDAGGACYWRF